VRVVVVSAHVTSLAQIPSAAPYSPSPPSSCGPTLRTNSERLRRPDHGYCPPPRVVSPSHPYRQFHRGGIWNHENTLGASPSNDPGFKRRPQPLHHAQPGRTSMTGIFTTLCKNKRKGRVIKYTGTVQENSGDCSSLRYSDHAYILVHSSFTRGVIEAEHLQSFFQTR